MAPAHTHRHIFKAFICSSMFFERINEKKFYFFAVEKEIDLLKLECVSRMFNQFSILVPECHFSEEKYWKIKLCFSRKKVGECAICVVLCVEVRRKIIEHVLLLSSSSAPCHTCTKI
jgi:hypothetical protein